MQSRDIRQHVRNQCLGEALSVNHRLARESCVGLNYLYKKHVRKSTILEIETV